MLPIQSIQRIGIDLRQTTPLMHTTLQGQGVALAILLFDKYHPRRVMISWCCHGASSDRLPIKYLETSSSQPNRCPRRTKGTRNILWCGFRPHRRAKKMHAIVRRCTQKRNEEAGWIHTNLWQGVPQWENWGQNNQMAAGGGFAPLAEDTRVASWQTYLLAIVHRQNSTTMVTCHGAGKGV